MVSEKKQELETFIKSEAKKKKRIQLSAGANFFVDTNGGPTASFDTSSPLQTLSPKKKNSESPTNDISKD
jgi:hypothetical protein